MSQAIHETHETQQSIWDWINETFPGTDPNSPRKSLRALEEMVELCLASGATPEQIGAAVYRSIGDQAPHEKRPLPDKIPSEAADVVIVLSGLAAMRGINLQAEIDKKMAINRARKWKANGDGTGYHVKTPSPELPQE